MAELISDNAEQRAFTAAAMNTLQCKPRDFSFYMIPYFIRYILTKFIIKTHSQHGFHWFTSSRFINLIVSLLDITF